ncbi:MAG: flagellar motor switch protein FliG [Planctomycetota bacterium]|nr:MAG: flagellar motor switch protein FliG [Planctomycetota bacterium]
MGSGGDVLNGSHKVAAVLLAIDHQLSSKILQHMGEDQLEQVTRAMKELEETAVGENDLRDIFKEAVQRMRGTSYALGDVGGTIGNVLVRAFGEERAGEILSSVEHNILAQRPFAVFDGIPPEDLANMLSDEHPQIVAVFLAHLDAAKAGGVVAVLPEHLRADVVTRIAEMGRSAPEVVQRVVEVMRGKVKELGLSTSRSEPRHWVKKAASILNNMGGGVEKEILDTISGRQESVAECLREEMFTFDDLSKLDKKSMQKVLGSIDTAVLATALKACSLEAENNIFENLSKRAAEMVVDERDAKGPTPLSDVLDAQKQILATIRGMIESGEVMAPGGAGEQLV